MEDGGEWEAKYHSWDIGQLFPEWICNRYYRTKPNGTQHFYESGDQKWKNSEWTQWVGEYGIPENQYLTRFFFVSYSTAYDATHNNETNSTVGNLLDGVWFSTDLPPAEANKGHLEVTKVVDGIPKEDLGNYTVEIDVLDAVDATVASGEIKAFTENADGTLTGTVAFQNLPQGSYTVKETVSNIPQQYEQTSTESDKLVKIEDQQTTKIQFVNSYKLKTGTLKVEKTWEGIENLPDKFQIEIYKGNTIEGDPVKTLTLNDVDEPRVTEKLTWTVQNLEAGQYVIKEVNAENDDYNVTASFSGDATQPQDTGEDLQAIVSVVANDEKTVSIKNTYVLKTGTLVFTKNLNALCDGDTMALFTVEIKNIENCETYYKTLRFTPGVTEQKFTITLPVGNYQIRELQTSGYTNGTITGANGAPDENGYYSFTVPAGDQINLSVTNTAKKKNPSIDTNIAINSFSNDGNNWTWVRK